MFSEICRVCEKSTNLINISLPNNNSILEYLAWANASYEPEDGLPPYICRLCATQLNYAYNLKQKCEETEIKLKNKFSLSLEATDTKQEFLEEFNEEDSTHFNDIDLLDTDENSFAAESPIPPSTKEHVRCDICNKKFLLMNELEKHMRKNHGMKNNHRQCSKCFKWLKTYRFYVKHMKNANHEKFIKCKFCDKTFRADNMARHIKAIHLELRRFICDICNKSFAQKVSLESHIVSAHMSEYNYSCSICNRAFKLKSSLKLHEVCHMPKDEQDKTKNLICQFCGKLFKSKSQFLFHERVHTGIKSENDCKICGKAFLSKSTLLKHERVHTGERLYECDICKRSLTTQGILKTHKLTHSDIKPYKCDICPTSFHLPRKLKLHKLIHTGEKPHQCNYCLKSFTQQGSLKAHVRIHTGEKPYKCEHCSKCFTNCSTWIRHKKVHIK